MQSPRESTGQTTITNFPIGMCYVPIQDWEEMYPMEKALCVGTAFPSLNLPFEGGGMA